MKKNIIITLILLIISVGACQASNFKEYKGDIDLKTIESSVYESQGVSVSKNVYKLKFGARKAGKFTEFIIANNTTVDLPLVGIKGHCGYFNTDMDKKHSRRFVPLTKAVLSDWRIYIPYVNMLFRALS